MDVVYGGMPQQSQGSGFDGILKSIFPFVALAGIGYLAYKLLLSPSAYQESGNEGGGTSSQNQQNQANTPTQGSQNNNSYGSPQNWQNYGATPVNLLTGRGQGMSISDVQIQASSQLQSIIGAVPRTVAQGGYVINQAPLFVTAGPTTPTKFFPGTTGTISSSQNLGIAEMNEVYQNLQNSGITNAWWSPTTTITQTTQPGGVNSGGSFQSNIPVGRNHCKCPYPGCGPNDDWTYC